MLVTMTERVRSLNRDRQIFLNLPSGMLVTMTELVRSLNRDRQIFLNLPSLLLENRQFSLACLISFDLESLGLIPARSMEVNETLMTWPSTFVLFIIATALTLPRESSISINAPSVFFSEYTTFLTFPKFPNILTNLSVSWKLSGRPVTQMHLPRLGLSSGAVTPVKAASKLAI